MGNINLMPPEEVEQMFARSGGLALDVTNIHRKYLDCSYGDDPRQSLDIYLPNEGDGPFPVVFFLHGGAWQHGRKDDIQLVSFIGGVSRGYAVVSIGYRLVPDIRYPENLFDVKAALRWVSKNADAYLLDSSRTALCGASAGAHLAMMAAFTQGQVAFGDEPGVPTCRILAVVEQFGPTDFVRFHAHYDESGFPRAYEPGAPNAVDAMLGVRALSISNLRRYFNPIDNVHPSVPPILLQHGRRDPIIPYQQAADLYKKVISVAGEGMAELDISEDFLHADPGYATPEAASKVFDFIDKHLI